MKIEEIWKYMDSVTSTWFGVKRLAQSHLEAHAEISQLKERIKELGVNRGTLEKSATLGIALMCVIQALMCEGKLVIIGETEKNLVERAIELLETERVLLQEKE